MSGQQFKDGKPHTPKSKNPKRQTIKQSVLAKKYALLLMKYNLSQENVADDFLNEVTRNKKIIERAINLANLQPFEMLMKLAATELRLETVQFLYDETYKQNQFLEASYNRALEKRVSDAASKSAGRAKTNQKYVLIKRAAAQVLESMQDKDFKLLGKKMRAKFPDTKLSPSTLRGYFLEITGLNSTKKLVALI